LRETEWGFLRKIVSMWLMEKDLSKMWVLMKQIVNWMLTVKMKVRGLKKMLKLG